MAEYINRLQLVSDICTRIKDVEYADGKDEHPFSYGNLTGLRMGWHTESREALKARLPNLQILYILPSRQASLLQDYRRPVSRI